MGWTIHTEYANDKSMTPKRYWEEIYIPKVANWDKDRYEVVAKNSYGTEFYAAIKDKVENRTLCLVALIEKNKYGIGIKEMDSSMGPCYYHASKKVLNALSEPINDWDREWREECIRKLEAEKLNKTNVNAVSNGMSIRFDSPYVIEGKHYRVFKVYSKSENLFKHEDFSGLLRINDWKKIPFTIIS